MTTGDRVRLKPTPEGVPTASVTTDDGRTILLHSAYNPITEAKSFALAAPIRATTSVVLLGLGLGYHVLQIRDRLAPGETLLVIEPDAQVARAARHAPGTDTLFNDKRITLAVALSPEAVREQLVRFMGDYYAHDFLLLPHPASLTASSAYFEAVRVQFETAQQQLMSDAQTRAALGPRFLANSLGNLDAAVSASPLDRLAGVAKGHPAFVIAAGPSLDINIDRLSDAQAIGPLIAVGTVSGILAQRGIIPDLVVTVDTLPETRAYFNDHPVLQTVPLAFDLEAAPEAIRFFTGPRFLIGSDKPVMQAIQPFLPSNAPVPHGLSVAHYAYEIAQRIGADAIVLVGQDLAFGADRSHATGITTTWGDQARHDDATLVQVPGTFAPWVTTNQGMLSFRNHFESRIAESAIPVFNATEGGAHIRGAQPVVLSDCITACNEKNQPAWESSFAQNVQSLNNGNRARLSEWVTAMRSEAETVIMLVADTNRAESFATLRNSPLLPLLAPAMANDVITMKQMEKNERLTDNRQQKQKLETKRMALFRSSVGQAARLFLTTRLDLV